MYLTDTVTNATVRNIKPEDLTFEQAVSLLAERAAAGPSPKAKRKVAKKAAKKAAPVKAAKKAAKKAVKQPQIGDDVDAPF
jgi:DNA topoisomerase-1